MELCRNRLLSKIFNDLTKVKVTKQTTCGLMNHVRFMSKDSKPKYERRIFSGIQPTGIPHIGNYFGAIKHWVALQDVWNRVILSVVDLHSLTVIQDPQVLRKNTMEMTACLLACGIDPQHSILFQQSSVSEHSQLAWVLGCMTTMPRLQHLPQWKQKSESMKEVPLGLFTYPVLQAADILLYKATNIPVGDDQVKHIELARHLAKLFNNKYGHTFPLPKHDVGDFNRIKSLRWPTQKMSKSEDDSKGRIDVTDTPDVIQEKLKKAVTDTTPYVTYDPEARPGISNLVDIHAAFTDLSPEEICEQCRKLDTLGYKMLVADVVIEGLARIRDRYQLVMSNMDHLEEIVDSGNKKAKEIAQANYADIKSKIGLI